MEEHKRAKNMFQTYINRHIIEQYDVHRAGCVLSYI